MTKFCYIRLLILLSLPQSLTFTQKRRKWLFPIKDISRIFENWVIFYGEKFVRLWNFHEKLSIISNILIQVQFLIRNFRKFFFKFVQNKRTYLSNFWNNSGFENFFPNNFEIFCQILDQYFKILRDKHEVF